MRRFILTVSASCLVALGLTPTSAHAQFPRYRSPAGSPLPNALNFFRGNNGLLDPYNAWVAPTQRLKDDLRTINLRQQELQNEEIANTAIRESGVAPTGIGSMFNNRSHYFPTTNQPVRRR
jgi:hypothetical protein